MVYVHYKNQMFYMHGQKRQIRGRTYVLILSIWNSWSSSEPISCVSWTLAPIDFYKATNDSNFRNENRFLAENYGNISFPNENEIHRNAKIRGKIQQNVYR